MGLLRKYFKIILLFIIILASVAAFIRHKTRTPIRHYADFHAYYVTGQRMIAGEDIYINRDKKLPEYRYTPFFAVLATNLVIFKEYDANTIWYLVNFFMLILIFILMKEVAIPDEKLCFSKSFWLYFLTFAANARFIFHNLDSGQSNIIILFFILLGVYCFSKKKVLTGGAFLAVSAMQKLTPLIFLPYFIARRKIKICFSTIAWLIFYFLIPTLILGVKNNFYYIKNFFHFLTTSTIMDKVTIYDHENQSLLSCIYRYFTNVIPFYPSPSRLFNHFNFDDFTINLIFIISALLIYALVLLPPTKPEAKEKPFYQSLDYALLLICATIFNPNAWMHNYLLLIFGNFLIFYYLIRNNWQDKTTLVLVILANILSLFTAKELCGKPFAYWSHFYSPHVFAAFILIFILFKLKFSRR